MQGGLGALHIHTTPDKNQRRASARTGQEVAVHIMRGNTTPIMEKFAAFKHHGDIVNMGREVAAQRALRSRGIRDHVRTNA